MTIPDYKVEAALRGWFDIGGDRRMMESCREQMKAALEAAAAAQEPPQVEVTAEQILAGMKAAHEKCCDDIYPEDVTAIYRAMRALEKKPEAKPKTIYWRKSPESTGGVRAVCNERSGKERRTERRALAAESVFGPTLYDIGRGSWGHCRRVGNPDRRQTQGDER
jgi:hypothetical protein